MNRWTIIILCLALGGTALADTCDGLLEVQGNGGKAWLGINAGGFLAGEGQTFTPACGGKLESLAFQVILDGLTWNEAPPLDSTSMLICSIRIPGVMTLGTVTGLVGFDLGTEWVTFDFAPQSLDLTGGQTYLITCAPAGTGQARLAYWQNEDAYDGGVRYVSEGGNNGPWIALDAQFGDLAFRVAMDVATPAEDRTWSEVKQLYR